MITTRDLHINRKSKMKKKKIENLRWKRRKYKTQQDTNLFSHKGKCNILVIKWPQH